MCKCKDNWSNLAAIIRAGSTAVKAACPTAEVIIQYAASKHLSGDDAGSELHKFYTGIASAGAPFDAFGLSMYQVWGAHSVSSLCAISAAARAVPDKKIYVIETAFPYQYGGKVHNSSDAARYHLQYPVSPQGQLSWLRALLYTVEYGLWGRGAGVSWWGAELVGKCSHQCGQFLDQDFVALPVLAEQGFAPQAKGAPPPGAVICPPL